MKTAISIPDKLFRAVDQYAKAHGVSRSKLSTDAVAKFLEQHPSELITKQLDEIYSSEPAKFDESVFCTQEETHQKRVLRSLTNKAKNMGFQLVPC